MDNKKTVVAMAGTGLAVWLLTRNRTPVNPTVLNFQGTNQEVQINGYLNEYTATPCQVVLPSGEYTINVRNRLVL